MTRRPKDPARRRRLVMTVSVGVLVVALVTGVAAVSNGYTAQRMDLSDAAVWVANERIGSLGRANTEILELNAVVEAGGSSSLVAQDGRTVLVLDRERATLDVIDPTTSTVADSVAAPPDADILAIAGSRVVIAAGGDVWTTPLDALGEFDSSRDPVLAFGQGAVISVDDAGLLFAFTPSTGELARVDLARSDTVDHRWQLAPLAGDAVVQLSSVAGHWALFDEGTRTLTSANGTVDLRERLPSGGAVRLQEASSTGEELLVASRSGLLAVAEDGGVRELVSGRAGAPAAPARFGGCLHAAWNDGAAWRSCDGGEGELLPIAEVPANPQLVFRGNGTALVLNDARSGRSWAASSSYGLIDNWAALAEDRRDDETVEQLDPEQEPTLERMQTPPVAVDDELGARPGRTTVLPVLLNDYDANGDVLVVDSVDSVEPVAAADSLDIVSNGQEIQLTLADDAQGEVRFRYTISDGRGGSAQAAVTVEVREPDENGPPVQARPTRLTAESGSRVSTATLGDWVDPDGDPVFLAGVQADAPDTVSSTADGGVTFTEGGGATGFRRLSLLVSDGRDTGGGTLTVDVVAPGTAPLLAEPFVIVASAGEDVEVEPLAHVRGGSGEVRLTAVPPRPDAVITPDFDGGGFRFSSAVARTHLLEYSVTDGRQTAAGTVRIEVRPPPDRDTVPITVPHTAFLRVGQPFDVDVLASDIDPTGGVLLVTGVLGSPELDGLRVEVVDHHLLRVALTRPLDTGSTTFAYRVSNGLADADGSVTVVEVPEPAVRQPPIAAADTASVRVGDVIDIPVLDNDSQPDGDRLALAPELVSPPAAGLLFASGDRLRYLAPDTPGEYDAVYRVDAPDGQFATANVHLVVRDVDAAMNVAPAPETVTARALAGETVRIRIPLDGIDADGDSVQLIGQESNPERGAVVDRGADWLEYAAGDYSAGADGFEYTVVDQLGARATGVVRIGIAARLDGARAPVAVEDQVTVRPGRTIAVRVLENDSDPDGGRLTITGVESTSEGVEATVDGAIVRVTAPEAEGRYGFVYTIRNDRLATASTFLAVEVRADAPLAAPEASDTSLALSDILDRETVDVDVLANVFFAEGPVRDLDVALVPGFDSGATVLPDGDLRIAVGDRRRIVPFTVSHPDDPSRRASAVVWVPGRDDALPQLRRGAPPIVVESGAEVHIDLGDYVVAASGRPVRLADPGTVRASHSDGGTLVVDDDTLRFRSEPDFFGLASMSFAVTDGASADDPSARTATLVVPIEVRPTENQPPAFGGGLIDFEPGQSKTIDLVRLTSYPYPDDLDELAFRLLDPLPEGFNVSLAGSLLTIDADPATPQGTGEAVAIGVRDAERDGRGGRIELRIVPSTRPLAVATDDRAIAQRGLTTEVDVLANDQAGNPFPGTPLRVVGVRGIDRSELPAGVSIEPNADRSKLLVTVAPDAAPGDSTVQYELADATGDASRMVWGTATISVQDRPDPVADARVAGFGDRTLDLSFSAGAANNSPISGFELELLDPGSGEPVASADCAATECTMATPGNGRAAEVRVRIVARNAIGLSDPVVLPGTFWSDVVPAAPTGVRASPLDGGIRLDWEAADPGSGSAVGSYVVTVAGISEQFPAGGVCRLAHCTVDWNGLANGQSVPFSVSARNDAYPALADWAEADGTGMPFGAPIAGGLSVDGDPAAGAVTVSWSPFDGNGDAIGGYFVQRLEGSSPQPPTGPQGCTVTTPAPGTVVAPTTGGSVIDVVRVAADVTSVRFPGVRESAKDTFVVWGWNGAGCVRTDLAGIVVRPAPGPVGPVASDMRWTDSQLEWDRYVSSTGGSWASIRIAAVDGSGSRIPGSEQSFPGTGWPRSILNRPFGEAVRFQVQGCTVWGSCGPWSEVLPADASPSLTFDVPGRRWDEGSSAWSWTSDPANPGFPVSYRCGRDGDDRGVPAVSPTSCRVFGAGPGERVWLDVQIGDLVARIWNR